MNNMVGLDAGCAYIKIAYYDENGTLREIRIPSLARHGKATVGMAGDAGVSYLCDHEEWSINPDNSQTEDTRFDSYPYSPMNAILSCHALIEAGFTGEVHIASGIPLNHYFNNGVPSEKRIKDKHKTYDLEVIRQGTDNPLKMISSKVCPEALAAWIDVCLDDDGSDREKLSRPVGLVDIGGRTTDIAVALPGFRIDPGSTGTMNIGYLDVCERLNNLLTEKYQAGRIQTYALDQSLQTREIQLYRGNTIDISELVDKAVATVASEIQREVERKLKKAGHLAGLCYFGGGAEHMRELLSKGENVHIPENAQFSSARGNLKALRFC